MPGNSGGDGDGGQPRPSGKTLPAASRPTEAGGRSKFKPALSINVILVYLILANTVAIGSTAAASFLLAVFMVSATMITTGFVFILKANKWNDAFNKKYEHLFEVDVEDVQPFKADLRLKK